ncbi:DMT family transporter [Vibrio sp. TRT 21S02]|uniref:DMT family transporter n=1 Tax=Vibrio sp. TRT 21S02 TaxID=3418507 RepID=UPI003CF2B422
MHTYLVTFVAMAAFAANSILCRLALQSGAIEPGTFTVIRLFSGAFVLVALSGVWKGRVYVLKSSMTLWNGCALFVYAIFFSYAYVALAAGTGALILFATVQFALIGAYLWQGHKLSGREGFGSLCAIVGFIILMLPGAQQPDLFAAIMMILSGLGWAAFTLLGQKSSSAVVGITQGFVGASLVMLFILPWIGFASGLSGYGVSLALLSGVVTSGGGYVLWYWILKRLSLLQASVAQLSVPLLAFIAGTIWLGEALSLQAVIASILILGGILVVMKVKSER